MKTLSCSITTTKLDCIFYLGFRQRLRRRKQRYITSEQHEKNFSPRDDDDESHLDQIRCSRFQCLTFTILNENFHLIFKEQQITVLNSFSTTRSGEGSGRCSSIGESVRLKYTEFVRLGVRFAPSTIFSQFVRNFTFYSLYVQIFYRS